MLLRLFTVYVSFMLKVRDNEREQYLHLSLTAAKQLEESNVVNYCLYALQIVYKYLLKQPIDENLLNEQTMLSPSGTTTSTTNTQTSSISIMTLLKPINQQSLPDLSPFFYKQYTKHHANDVFEAYPELLAEIATRLPYQMKKVIDYTSESRPFLLSSDWQKCLCEYYVLPQGSFLKRQIRKLLMYICGSRDKYRKLRDFHVLSTNLAEIKNIHEENFSLNNTEQRKTMSTQIPYVTLMRLVDHLKSCQDISIQRCSNWQKFCKNDPTILHFLVQLIMLVDDSLVPFILHLLINSISSPSSSTAATATAATATTSTSNRTLKTSKSSVRPNDFDSTDDISICSIALQFSKIISNKLLEDFIRLFLLENNQQSIRWLTHTFLYNLYINSNKQLQDYIFDLLINLWSTISYYGLKSFQYIDLLGYIIIKNKDDKRTNEFLPKLELMLKTQNQLLLNHPNTSIYRRLSTIIDIEQNNEIKRNKAVRTIRFYDNNRHVQSIVDLKNSVNCKWLLAKTIKLTNIQQTEVKIDFVIPIIACNLMIEYVDFFETPTSSIQTVTDTTTLQCPRCNSAVAATPGICPNCGENVFQCHKCRSINYDERDPFLCNSCGYCKYCKFDFIFTAKQVNYVEPIESDEDRAKTIANIGQLLEKTDKIYRQLINQKPILEYLLTKLNSDDQNSTLIPSLSTTTATTTTTTTTTANTTTTGETSDQQQQPPTVPTPTITLTSANNPNGINRIVQQIAPKYNTECRQTYDELGKCIQKIICTRKELYTYDQRHSNSSSTTTTMMMITTIPSRSHHCYGCILSTISHCILLLRAFITSSNRLKQSITNNISLIDELLLNNIRYTNQQIRHDVHGLKQKYKSILIAIVLNGYLTLKKLIVQRTKLIDEAQNKMLELLEQMTRGNEQETRQFMIICIDTIEKFQLDDMQTPLFIFERLCNLIYTEETMQENKEFFIVVEKDPNQEDFLQGRMMGNPYSSADPAMGPLMRDIKNKICTDCELIALLEDDNGMELLVANKIINLGLAVRDVYKKVWLPYINSHQGTPSNADPTAGSQPVVSPSQNEHEPMHIVYRMRGLLGDATEDIIETFDTKKNANENGEDDPEDIYRLANVLSEHSGLETMLKRLDSIPDMSSGKALLQILLKLLEYAIKLKVNRQRLIDPNLRAISSMLNKLNLLLKTEIEEQGRDQGLLSLTEKLLFIMDQLFHEASTTLSQDKYNEFSVSCEGDIEQLRLLLNYIKLPFVKTHPSIMEALIHLLPYLSFGNKEKMQTLLDYFKSYLEFDRFDLEQISSSSTTTIATTSNDNDSQLHLDCFCEICKHLDKKSVYGKEFRDYVNESNGIIDQCINYIETNSPQVKTYLGMQDQDSWKEFLNKPSLSYVLRLLTGLSYGHEQIQMKIGQSLIPILHKIEQLTTAGKVGVLAEDLLHSLTENEQVAKKIDDVRNQTRAEKKRLAQEARDRKMRELNLTKITRNKSESESSATASKIPVPNVDLTDETGHVCCICREGYKYFPNKVLAIYTFTKKIDIEPYEAKTRKTPGYATVTHFNIIHIECHTSAIKQARSRDEWESALLQNANTRCNGLLPLWGPDVAEAQFTTALARYDTNIIEATGIRETSPTLSIHDIKLLLLRFADVQSFSEDTGGGGRESNIRLVPYEMHTILYVLTTTRQIEREEKLLQNYLSRPDLLINEAFEVDGPFFLTTLSLIIMKPNDWEKNRRIFLQKLLLTAHIRSVNTPNDRTKIASKALKPFATYKTTLVFFGLINAFFVHMLNPRFDTTSTIPYNQQLAQFLRCNDAFIMEACTKILKHFEQDLLSSQTFETLFNALDLSQLSEQWIQDAINVLP
ncbi:unnamed protein product [Rotaria sp. Silwood2]|nr:unnamed protein product [Rotaria sp. Silwood2]